MIKKAVLTLLTIAIVIAACKKVSTNKKEKELVKTNTTELKRDISSTISQVLLQNSDSTGITLQRVTLEAATLVRKFYATNVHQSAWTDGYQLNKSGKELVSLLEKAESYGLQPTYYNYSKITSLISSIRDSKNKRTTNSLSVLDILLTNSYFLYQADLAYGVIDPKNYSFTHKVNLLTDKDVENLQAALQKEKVRYALLTSQPSYYHYKNLQKGLAKNIKFYQKNKKQSFTIDYKEDSTANMEKAMQSLLLYGYLDSTKTSDSSSQIAALKKFQYYNGLNQDGKIGKHTAAAFSKSVMEDYEKVVINLERLRWLNAVDTADHLFVNIPSYTLYVSEKNKMKDTFRVVTGTPYDKTPEFSDEIEYLVSYPYWNVPQSIMNEEILPAAKKEGNGYLSKRNYAIYDRDGNTVSDVASIDNNKYYRIVQDGGRSNALGLVKFIFPNQYSVFLHDTPSKKYFKKDIRAYSHGCIRLQDPLDLAGYLLKKDNNEIQRKDLEELIEKRNNKKIILNNYVPIHIKYITTLADKEGNVFYYKDVYKKDGGLIKAMFNKKAA